MHFISNLPVVSRLSRQPAPARKLSST